jgi:hypothetical protein
VSSFTPTHHSNAQLEDERIPATVLFDFTSTSPFELSVTEGSNVHIIEEDDGSGWVKVVDAKGGKGLVPATYIEISHSHPAATPLKTRSFGSGRYVKGLYAYQAQGDDELSVEVGGLIELSDIGQSYGDGWWEGFDKNGKKGIFPDNYVQLV